MASKMQKALTGPQAGTSLTGTMPAAQTAAAGTAAPPPPAAAATTPQATPTPGDAASENAAIEGYKSRLTEIMKSHKDVDYDQLYGALMEKVNAQQPQTKKVNPLVAAAAAFGSPRAGEQMLGLASQRSQEQKAIDEKRLGLQLQILDRKIEQAQAKGKADEALEANAEATRLETELQRIRDERTARHQKELAETQATGRKDLEQEKQTGRERIQAMKDAVNRERIKSANDKLGTLKLRPEDQMAMTAEKQAAFNALDKATDFNQETMTMPSPEAIRAAHESFDQTISDIQTRYSKKVISTGTGGGGIVTPPAPGTETPSPTAEGGSRWAAGIAAAKRAREAAAQPKK